MQFRGPRATFGAIKRERREEAPLAGDSLVPTKPRTRAGAPDGGGEAPRTGRY